jgi:mannose-6-phosphate isomerase-like protein (cupin superfamily)
MPITRRALCSLLPGAFVLKAWAQQEAANALPSATFPYDQLPVKKNPNGSETRAVFKGKLKTGEPVEVHATVLPPGGMPHAAHHHVHSEMWLIREGETELTINGKSQRLGPGSIGFVESGDEHGIKNVGTAPARYFVVAIGPGAAGG